MKRREFLAGSIATAAVAAGASIAPATQDSKSAAPSAAADEKKKGKMAGRIRQSVCRWCYGSMPLDELCRNVADIGMQSVELLTEKEWAETKKAGITCALSMGPSGISPGWNRIENHDKFVKESERLLPLIKAEGIPSMIVFSGNRDGLSDADGIKNCVAGLKRIMPLAESLGINVFMELLNSKVDHHDYQCDHTPWGVEVVKGIASDRFKLLYDIYHMQIMEGDVIRTITDNIKHIGHFHTGGVPGRHEIDESQELNYTTVCKAILETGFKGYLAQEFIPTRDAMTSLRAAAAICDV